MKKNIVLLFIAFIVLISCKSKVIDKSVSINKKEEINYIPYYLKVYEADSLYLSNNFQKSYEILDSLFKVYEPLNINNYAEYGNYLNSAVMSGHLEDIDNKVKYSYTKFGTISAHHIQSYEMYELVNSTSKYSYQELEDFKKTYYNSLNLDLRKRMLKMEQEDQQIRNDGADFEKIDSIDNLHKKEIDAIFKEYGFPKKSLIGSNNAYDVPDGGSIHLNILFIHQADSVKIKYLPILLENVKKGFCEPEVYAEIYDRMMMDKYRKQYFGTYTCNSDDELCPLLNPKKIDSIRKSIGLPNVKYHSWKMKKLGH